MLLLYIIFACLMNLLARPPLLPWLKTVVVVAAPRLTTVLLFLSVLCSTMASSDAFWICLSTVVL